MNRFIFERAQEHQRVSSQHEMSQWISSFHLFVSDFVAPYYLNCDKQEAASWEFSLIGDTNDENTRNSNTIKAETILYWLFSRSILRNFEAKSTMTLKWHTANSGGVAPKSVYRLSSLFSSNSLTLRWSFVVLVWHAIARHETRETIYVLWTLDDTPICRSHLKATFSWLQIKNLQLRFFGLAAREPCFFALISMQKQKLPLTSKLRLANFSNGNNLPIKLLEGIHSSLCNIRW